MRIVLTRASTGATELVAVDRIIAPVHIPWKDRSSGRVPPGAESYVMFSGGGGGFFAAETVEEVEAALARARARGANSQSPRNPSSDLGAFLRFDRVRIAPERTAVPHRRMSNRLTYTAPEADPQEAA